MNDTRSGESGTEKKAYLKKGQVILDRYRIEDAIARGGMGTVYLATQLPLERRVALKLLNGTANRSPAFRKRFLLEASSCARLSHRHIVTVHDYGETESGSLFMAMEFIDGESLSKVLNRNHHLEPVRACQLAVQISRALRTAHRAGVVHRDLKPSNIMVLEDQEDEDGLDFVKVVDFGLAKLFEEPKDGGELTKSGTVLGSPRYMAPEQIRGGTIDPRADIYSLGVLIYRMLTGVHPFDAPSTAEILSKHLRDPAPAFSEAASYSLPQEVEIIVQRCLQKDPGDRYQQVGDLLDDLKAAIRLLGHGSLSGESLSLDLLSIPPLAPPSQTPIEAIPPPSMSVTPTHPVAEDLVLAEPSTPPPQKRSAILPLVAALLLILCFVAFGLLWSRMNENQTVASLTVRTDPPGVVLVDRSGRPLGPAPIQVDPDKVHVVAAQYENHRSALLPLLPKPGQKEVSLNLSGWIASLEAPDKQSPQTPAKPVPQTKPEPPSQAALQPPPPRTKRRTPRRRVNRSRRTTKPTTKKPSSPSLPLLTDSKLDANTVPMLDTESKTGKVPLLDANAGDTKVPRLDDPKAKDRGSQNGVPLLKSNAQPAVPMLDKKDEVPLLDGDPKPVERLD